MTPMRIEMWPWMLVLACALTKDVRAATEPEVDTDDEPEAVAAVVDLAAVTLRVRIKSVQPAGAFSVHWHHGGEGLGGEVRKGVVADKLELNQWSEPMSVTPFNGAAYNYVTFTLAPPVTKEKRPPPAVLPTTIDFEFELSYQNKVVKTVTEPSGTTAGLHLPLKMLGGKVQPSTPAFLNEVRGILEVSKSRADTLEALPWAKWPLPRKYLIITDMNGYGETPQYGVRHSNKKIVEHECRALRQLGINGLRAVPDFLAQMIAERKEYAADLARGSEAHGVGYPCPRATGKGQPDPEAGCPFGPGVPKRQAADLEKARELLKLQVPEVWGLTDDEIGPIINAAADKKNHINSCPHCQEGFRQFVKSNGVTLQDLEKKDWSEVVPIYGQPAETPGATLNRYYTGKFVNWSSARLFTPLRDQFHALNEEKRKAMASGDTTSAAAKRPFVYTFALRGNNFLMGGSSLDFFEFYRHADNAFVYETSNRDCRIWSWDSYLCDVGRTLDSKQKIPFGIYIKPHRGAVIQRMLAAVSRNARMLFWYTYGPEYKKGDSFASRFSNLEDTSKAAHLLGKAEDVLYDSSWVFPAEVAVVRPWWSNNGAEPVANAVWEEGKWTYTALQHAHIPVDALDETHLLQEDISRYKVIYITGASLPKAVAAKLEKWIEAGGVLYTSATGLCRDESGNALAALAQASGLKSRGSAEMWYNTLRYGATQICNYDDPKRVVAPVPSGAVIHPGNSKTALTPVLGREVLQPAEGTEVLAKFADGSAAMTRNTHGKGAVYIAGFFPGQEYSAAFRKTAQESFDMTRDFDMHWREFVTAPLIDRVKPVVDVSNPAVEGVLLKNIVSGKRCVTLANWAYRMKRIPTQTMVRGKVRDGFRDERTHCTLENVHIAIRGAADCAKVSSAFLDKDLVIQKDGESLIVTLPRLEEGDVLLLE
jgi:hypothetical protein